VRIKKKNEGGRDRDKEDERSRKKEDALFLLNSAEREHKH